MWKLPLEFEKDPPSRARLSRKGRRKVKTPPVPKVKSSELKPQTWISPQFNHDMLAQAVEEKSSRVAKGKGGGQAVRLLLKSRPLLLSTTSSTSSCQASTSDKNTQTLTKEKPKSRKMKNRKILEFCVQPKTVISTSSHLPECSSSLQSVSDEERLDISECMEQMSIENIQNQPGSEEERIEQSEAKLHQMTFNPSVSSTPCASAKGTLNSSSFLNDKSHLSMTGGDALPSVLAFDTPSHLYDCGLLCKVKENCSHV